jgi:hypothetical protein
MMGGYNLKEAGCAKVIDNTPDDWKEATLAIIKAMASSGMKFHAEDVRKLAGDPPNHPNAFGAMFNAAVKMKLIVRVGDIMATRDNAHARRISLYKGARYA